MHLLLRQLRVIEFNQLSHLSPFNQSSKHNLKRWLRKLTRQQLLQTTRTVTIVPELSTPLIDWIVGDPAPQFKTVSNQLRRRWHTWQPKRCQIFWASFLATHYYGGVAGGKRQPLQLAHDLGTSAIYNRTMTQNSFHQQNWIGEDLLRTHENSLQFVPDAALLDSNQRLQKLIEFGGQYSRQKLQRFHQAALAVQLSYELW